MPRRLATGEVCLATLEEGGRALLDILAAHQRLQVRQQAPRGLRLALGEGQAGAGQGAGAHARTRAWRALRSAMPRATANSSPGAVTSCTRPKKKKKGRRLPKPTFCTKRMVAPSVDAPLHLDLPEARLVRGDPHVGGKHQLQRGGEGDAAGGDHHRRPPGAKGPGRKDRRRPGAVRGSCRWRTAGPTCPAPGRRRRAGPRRRAGRSAVRRRAATRHSEIQLQVHGVLFFRAVLPDAQHMALAFDFQVLAHVLPL